MHGDTRSLKTSEVGANSRLTPSTHQLTPQPPRGIMGLTASCIHSLIRESFATFSARRVLSSPACVSPPERRRPGERRGEVSGRGRMNLCFSPVSLLVCQRQQLFLTLVFLTLMFLFPVFDVCVFLKTSVFCRCLRQVQLVELVCLPPFSRRVFWLCSWS